MGQEVPFTEFFFSFILNQDQDAFCSILRVFLMKVFRNEKTHLNVHLKKFSQWTFIP